MTFDYCREFKEVLKCLGNEIGPEIGYGILDPGGGGGGGGALPIVDYTGRLRPKGVPFSDWRYIKGYGLHELNYRKGMGKLTFSYQKGHSKYPEQTHPMADSSKNFKGFLM